MGLHNQTTLAPAEVPSMALLPGPFNVALPRELSKKAFGRDAHLPCIIKEVLFDAHVDPPLIKFGVQFYQEFFLVPVDPSKLRFLNISNSNFVLATKGWRGQPQIVLSTEAGKFTVGAVDMDLSRGWPSVLQR